MRMQHFLMCVILVFSLYSYMAFVSRYVIPPSLTFCSIRYVSSPEAPRSHRPTMWIRTACSLSGI